MVHLMASSVCIPPLLTHCALNAQISHSITEFPLTADNVILLVTLDVYNLNGTYVSIPGHNVPVLDILRSV
jgi:hypothetical protein